MTRVGKEREKETNREHHHKLQDTRETEQTFEGFKTPVPGVGYSSSEVVEDSPANWDG